MFFCLFVVFFKASFCQAAFQKFGLIHSCLFSHQVVCRAGVFNRQGFQRLGFNTLGFLYGSVFLGLGFQMGQWNYTYLYTGFFMSGFL